jgi:hypothetical protein
MKLRAARKTRAAILWRCCAISLVGLLITMGLSACGTDGSATAQSCSGSDENYQGTCMPHATVEYLACIKDVGFTTSSEVGLGVTLPVVADSTVKLAYSQSKQEDTLVALVEVHNCLVIAERDATLSSDRSAAQQYSQQTNGDITKIATAPPEIELDPAGTLNCGQADVSTPVQCPVTIKSTGAGALHITRAEVGGTNSSDFTAGNDCTDKWLNSNQSCVLTVQFTPSESGGRSATLVIHQNLPAPDQGTLLQLTGTGNNVTTQQPQHSLIVNVSGPVTVTSNPPGITDCTSTCQQLFSDATDITLTASYDHSSGQVSWDGCTPSVDTCTLHLVGDTTVTVSLAPVPPVGEVIHHVRIAGFPAR